MKLLIKQNVGDISREHLQIVDNVVNYLKQHISDLEFLPADMAASSDDYQLAFRRQTGIEFTPNNYRNYRLRLLSVVDAVLYIHTSANDSDAYELSHNLSALHPKPVFFAIWRGAPIQSPLLKDLDLLYPVSYCQFSYPQELLDGFKLFLQQHGCSIAIPA